MSDFNKEQAIKELEALTARADAANSLLTEAKARKDMLNQNIEQKRKEAQELGVDPDKLDETIEGLEKEIAESIEKLSEMIPTELLIKLKWVDEDGKPIKR